MASPSLFRVVNSCRSCRRLKKDSHFSHRNEGDPADPLNSDLLLLEQPIEKSRAETACGAELSDSETRSVWEDRLKVLEVHEDSFYVSGGETPWLALEIARGVGRPRTSVGAFPQPSQSNLVRGRASRATRPPGGTRSFHTLGRDGVTPRPDALREAAIFQSQTHHRLTAQKTYPQWPD